MTENKTIRTTPLITLKNAIHNNGLTQKRLAKELGISRVYLNMLLNGNKPLTPQMAKKLELLTDVSAKYLLGKKPNGFESKLDVDLKKIVDGSSSKIKSLKNESFVLNWKKSGSRELTDREIDEAIKEDYLVLKPYNPYFLEPVSYRLRSNRILLQHTWDSIELDDESVEIPPHKKVAIMTKEWLEVPRNIFAMVTPTTKIMDEMISMSSGFLVHPGFKGCLYFVLYNLTEKPIEIKRNMEFLRIRFSFSKMDPDRIYEGTKQNMKDFPERFKERFCDELGKEVEPI